MSWEFLARRAAMGAALGFAVGLSYFLPAVPVLLDMGAPLAGPARTMIGNETLSVMLLALLMSISERWGRGAAARLAGTALAMAVTLAVKLPLVSSAASAGWLEMGAAGPRGAQLFAIWHVLAAGVLLALYFGQQRRIQVSSGRLRAARVERQRVEGDLLESRLNVIRARVDPVFLFEALAEVRRAYGRDAAEGERVMDDLIAFLRASLPTSHDRGSTLAGELDLAAAYLKVISSLRGRAFRLHADVPDALRAAFFPPMVLLPLVDDALRRTRSDSLREAAITVRGRIDGGCARLVVEDAAGATLAAPAGLDGLLTTLRAFMGEARIATRIDGAGCSVAVEFPFTAQLALAKEVA